MTAAQAKRLKQLIQAYTLAAAYSGGAPTFEQKALNDYITELTHEPTPIPRPSKYATPRRW